MKVLYSDRIVLNDNVTQGYIHIEDGVIKSISADSKSTNIIDFKGKYILPGLINIQSEQLIRENRIKANNMFPFQKTFKEVEMRFASAGITTLFHSIPIVNGRSQDDFTTGPNIAKKISELSKGKNLIDHKVHIEFQLGFIESMDKVKELLEGGFLDYISYLGYCRTEEERYREVYYQEYIQRSMGLSEEICRKMVKRVRELRSESNLEELAYMLKYSHYKGVKVGSSELDTMRKLDYLQQDGVNILEYPFTMDAIDFAKGTKKQILLDTLSLSKGKGGIVKLDPWQAVLDGKIDMLSSDMRPYDLLAYVFLLGKEMGLENSVKLVSKNPATALELIDRGEIKEGMRADLIAVDVVDEVPVTVMTMSQGNVSYSSNYR